MPLLGDQDRTALSEIFAKELASPVAVDLFTQRASPLVLPSHVMPSHDCQTCRETEDLLREVAALSSHITLRVRDFVAEADAARRAGVDRIPALVFRGKNKGTVRYFGAPAGYEFSVLVADLLEVAGGATQLGAATREQAAALSSPVHIKVLVTPT
jgi:alkyl hydroperoxide reductase subunit AhpF